MITPMIVPVLLCSAGTFIFGFVAGIALERRASKRDAGHTDITHGDPDNYTDRVPLFGGQYPISHRNPAFADLTEPLIVAESGITMRRWPSPDVAEHQRSFMRRAGVVPPVTYPPAPPSPPAAPVPPSPVDPAVAAYAPKPRLTSAGVDEILYGPRFIGMGGDLFFDTETGQNIARDEIGRDLQGRPAPMEERRAAGSFRGRVASYGVLDDGTCVAAVERVPETPRQPAGIDRDIETFAKGMAFTGRNDIYTGAPAFTVDRDPAIPVEQVVQVCSFAAPPIETTPSSALARRVADRLQRLFGHVMVPGDLLSKVFEGEKNIPMDAIVTHDERGTGICFGNERVTLTGGGVIIGAL